VGRVSTPVRQARVRAPELRGRGGWIGTGGADLTLAGLRGRIVLLDFWTSCCVNCLHVLSELRPLEERFADVLVTVGVHSPKFEHEREHAVVVDAVERYGVGHPVLDDPDLETWQQYAVRAWPTLCVVDPEGYLVHVASGEGHADGLARVVEELVAVHEAKGTLRRGDGPWVALAPGAGTLRFPGGLLALADGHLLVSDTGSHRLVELEADGETVVRVVGTGDRGLVDGPHPRFAEPQGLCLLPDGRVLVADTANHCLRALDLTSGEVTTVAGTGEQWRPGDPAAGAALEVRLSTPWDVAVHGGRVVIAMAGTHQLWSYDGGDLAVLAGTTGEGLRDGDATKAYLAQPSGLASDGDRLWFVDAETSALRWYRDTPAGGEVGTVVGTGLFDFGHRDGPARDALLQHPLGVALLPDGSVAVCDTYNGAVRRYDPVTDEVSTLATGVAEPTAAVVVDGDLVVAASAAHRLERPVAPGDLRRIHGPAQRTVRPVLAVAPGEVALDVVFDPPAGQHLDERYGPATRLVVSASPPQLLVAGAGSETGLSRRLVLAGNGEGVLHVAASAASCDVDAEHPACHVAQQDWGLPVRVTRDGTDRVALVLRGLDA
jgi:thiol-disulfide isomerase/thioredoxin